MRAFGWIRQDIPTVWDDVCALTRAGLRRYGGTDLGERYGRVIAHHGEGSFADPTMADRLLGDLLHPRRTGSVMALVNGVSRDVSMDVAGWRLERIWHYYIGLEQRPRPDAED